VLLDNLKISQLVDIYYKKVAESGDRKASGEILEAIRKLDYDMIKKSFR
jgi:hypothetical protein